jgi:hypothetical protein
VTGHNREAGPSSGSNVERATNADAARASSVYDEIAKLLRARGWAQGAPRRGSRLCITAAIDEVVGVGDATRDGSEGFKLQRAARIGAHLRDLLNVRNLAAWADDRTRTFEDIVGLLAQAALAFPED